MHSPPLGRGPAECICNLQLQPSHSDPTSLGQGDCKVHLQSGIAAEPPTNAAGHPAIAAEILQLQPRFCNPKGGGGASYKHANETYNC